MEKSVVFATYNQGSYTYKFLEPNNDQEIGITLYHPESDKTERLHLRVQTLNQPGIPEKLTSPRGKVRWLINNNHPIQRNGREVTFTQYFYNPNTKNDQFNINNTITRGHVGLVGCPIQSSTINLTLSEQKYSALLEFEEFIKTLKASYLKKDKIPLLIGGELSIEDHYTTLAIITEEEKEEKKEELKGNTSPKELDLRIPTYESIFKPKKAIQLEVIFNHKKLNNNDQKRIVVQGSAGIGKSTLCQRIAYQWAQGKLWPKFKAIFWIKFRDLPNTASTVYEVIAEEYGFESKQIENLFEQENFRENTLIVLDGYDELRNKDLKFRNSKGSLSIIKAFQEEFSRVIITTRPQEIPDFQSNANLEILGFEDTGIDKYIKNFFGKKDEKQAIDSQFENPLVHSLCHIPINLEIFCSLAIKGETFSKDQPLNLATIYNKLTEWLIKRFGKERLNELEFPTSDAPSVSEIKEYVNAILEKIAWSMMKKETLFISSEEIGKISLQVFKTGIQILLQKVSNMKSLHFGPIRIEKEEGRFIHLTFQEFFAAKYIARLFKGDDQALKEAKKIIAEKKFHPRYQLVFSMIAGLLIQDMDALQEFFKALYERPRDRGESRELILLARYFEECGECTKDVDQYLELIQKVQQFLEDDQIPDQIKFDTLNRNHHLIKQEKIAECFVKSIQKFASLLQKLAETKTCIPQQIINALGTFLLDSTADSDAKSSAAYTLREVAKGGSPLSEEALKGLISVLPDPTADRYVKMFAAEALEEVAKGEGPFAKEALKKLLSYLLDPKKDSNAQRCVAEALEKVAKSGTPFAEKALEELSSCFLNHNGDSNAKSCAMCALGGVAKKGISLPEAVLNEVIRCLPDPSAKRSAAYILREVAKKGISLPEEALNGLISCLFDSNRDSLAQRYAAEALEKVAKRGTPLAAKAVITGLISFLVDPKGDSLAKMFAAEALGGVIEEGGTSFAEEALNKLVSCFRDLNADSFAQRYAAEALGEVAEGGTSIAKKALTELINCFLDPNADSFAQRCAAEALGTVAKGRIPLPKEVLNGLIFFLLNPKTESINITFTLPALVKKATGEISLTTDALKGLISCISDSNVDNNTKRSAAEALGEIVKGETSLAQQALEGLISCILHPKSNDYAKNAAAYFLGEVAQARTLLAEQALEGLIFCLLDTTSDSNAKSSAAFALGEVAQMGIPLPEQALEGLSSCFLNSKVDIAIKDSAAFALGEVAKRKKGAFLSEEVIKGLSSFLVDPKADIYAKSSAASALGEVAKGGTTLPEEAINGLISFLLDCKVDSQAKNSAAEALGEVAKLGTLLPEEAINGLISFLLDSTADSDAKSSAAEALGRVVQGGTSIAKKALKMLNSFFLDPNPNVEQYNKSFAAEALVEVAKRGIPLSAEVIKGLISFLLDPNIEQYNKRSAAKALLEVAKKETPLAAEAINGLISFLLDPNMKNGLTNQVLDEFSKFFYIREKKDIKLFIQICKLHEKIFYKSNSEYYVSDQRDIYQVKEHDQYKINMLYSSIESGSFEKLKTLCEENPKLLNDCEKNGWTPFHASIASNQLKILEWLYKQNSQFLQDCCMNSNNSSLFHLAASLGHIEIGQWLLEKFPDLLNSLNTNVQTPYTIAKLNGKTEFVDWIASKGGKEKIEEDNNSCAVM